MEWNLIIAIRLVARAGAGGAGGSDDGQTKVCREASKALLLLPTTRKSGRKFAVMLVVAWSVVSYSKTSHHPLILALCSPCHPDHNCPSMVKCSRLLWQWFLPRSHRWNFAWLWLRPDLIFFLTWRALTWEVDRRQLQPSANKESCSKKVLQFIDPLQEDGCLQDGVAEARPHSALGHRLCK